MEKRKYLDYEGLTTLITKIKEHLSTKIGADDLPTDIIGDVIYLDNEHEVTLDFDQYHYYNSGDGYQPGSSKTIVIGSATADKAGLMSAEDKKKVDGFDDSIISFQQALEGDKPLVGLKISYFNGFLGAESPWQVFMADGSKSGVIVPMGDLTTIYGYQVTFTGNYMWQEEDGKKNPTAVGGGDFSKVALPASGVCSDHVTISGITNDRSITAQVKAPKRGLVVDGSAVRLAKDSEFDVSSASLRVHFRYKTVMGAVDTALTENTLRNMLAKGGGYKLQDGRSGQITGVTATETQYYVYAYPSVLGDLQKITMNDSTPLLDGGFTLSKLTITDPETRKQLEYNVYTSVKRGAFSDAKLDMA